MKCKHCDGLGYIRLSSISGVTCGNCKGTGKTEHKQTNEEWLDTLSTVDKAIWLSKVAEKLKGNVWMWENWLKAVHKEFCSRQERQIRWESE